MTAPKHTQAEAQRASLEYFERLAPIGAVGAAEIAADVFAKKYALTDQESAYEELTPDDMHRRLASELARVEQRYPNPIAESEIYELLRDFRRIVPQGSPQAAIGNPHQLQTVSNCYVVDSPLDSYGGIFRTDQQIAQIMKRRGGVGTDVSRIRPKGLVTRNAAKTTDGLAVFMDRFSNTTREVAQDGRRGALMLTCSVHHPEIVTFVRVKRDLKRVTGANVSTRLTDEFMEAVAGDGSYEQRWPCEDAEPALERWVPAREVWREIVTAAHESAEPGALFWSTIQRETLSNRYPRFRVASSNPCGEQLLAASDSCRLFLVNSKTYVARPFEATAAFDYEAFGADVEAAQKLMDDLVDLDVEAIDRILSKIASDPEDADAKRTERDLWERIRETALAGRRTGLGLTAVGDAIAMLGLRYGSAESVSFVDKLYRTLAVHAWLSSARMARDRGAFPEYDAAVEAGHPFLERVMSAGSAELRELHSRFGRRNVALTTTSPAGSTSIETMSTNGIEPCIFVSAKRRRKLTQSESAVVADYVDALGDRWQEYDVFHPGVAQWMSVVGSTDASASPYAGSTCEDVDPDAAVDVQAAAQRWICNSISKTVNLPATATVEDVARIYQRAWRTGCKGITVYRAGSRSGVIVRTDGGKPKATAKGRPRSVSCVVHRGSVEGDPYVVFVGLVDGKPYEIFAGRASAVSIPKGVKSGVVEKRSKQHARSQYDFAAQLDETAAFGVRDIVSHFENPVHGAFTRTVSLALRSGVDLAALVEQLNKDKTSHIGSFARLVARALKPWIADGSKSGSRCLECDVGQLVFQEGCTMCPNCGTSKCG